MCGEAGDGVEAIKKARELQPDLILLEFTMPKMSGLEVARALKLMMPQVPVIMFTFYKEAGLEPIAYAAGVDMVISKQDSITALSDSARTLLRSGVSTP